MVDKLFEGAQILSQLQCSGMTSVLDLMQQVEKDGVGVFMSKNHVKCKWKSGLVENDYQI